MIEQEPQPPIPSENNYHVDFKALVSAILENKDQDPDSPFLESLRALEDLFEKKEDLIHQHKTDNEPITLDCLQNWEEFGPGENIKRSNERRVEWEFPPTTTEEINKGRQARMEAFFEKQYPKQEPTGELTIPETLFLLNEIYQINTGI